MTLENNFISFKSKKFKDRNMDKKTLEDLLNENKGIGSDFLKNYKSYNLPETDRFSVPSLDKKNNSTNLGTIQEDENEKPIIEISESNKPKKHFERFLEGSKQQKHVTFVLNKEETPFQRDM